MSHIDCIHPDGDEGDGGCVSGDSFAFQESGDMRELPLSGVEAVTFGGNVSAHLSNENHQGDMRELPLSGVEAVTFGGNVSAHLSNENHQVLDNDEDYRGPVSRDRGNVSMHLLTETNDVLDTRTVPLSRVFERFRNLGFNAFDRQTTDDREIQTPTAGATGVGSHVGSPSAIAPVNHAYLCLNVTDCIIRPAIIPFVNSRLENAYQSHARGDNSDTIDLMSPDNEGGCSTSVTERIVESSCVRSATLKTSSSSRYASSRSLPHERTVSYIDLGDCNQRCRHCGCLFWYNERLKSNNYGRRAEYHLCCGGGKIYMPPLPDPPVFVQQLLTNAHFMEHIRAYNQMFAMTSFGAKVDSSVNTGRGPYVFKVSGQIYHWIGSLCPEEGDHPRFLQLYIHDTHTEVANRLRNFGHQNEDTLNPEIVEGLIHVLDEHNGLVRLFRTARDRYNAGEIPSFKIRLYNKGGARGYEFPTSDVLGGIVFEDGPKSRTDFDVIVEFRAGHPQRINKLHQSYMSLQFPLMFVFGEPGFYPELLLKPRDGSGRGKKVTMNAYYKYQLHPRVKGFGLIFRCGRLFQQYVVTAFCAVEQSRLDFIRKRQNDLRSDYLLGLYDAISQGDREGIQAGSMVMLPRTFTGGPRYMYSHYLDALAICRSLGNPQFFITFTCNVKWPEIKRYMSQYPGLTATDRADIVCRVFEQKINDFISFLKYERPFGYVIAFLYTIEFQKRGLPHCHTLLWVDSSSKIHDASQIDNYISAELPDPVEDPEGYKVVSKLMMHGPCGVANPSASCTEKGICNKHFPKMYNDKTFFDTNGHTHYRRRQTQVHVMKGESRLDNCNVVPYNRVLCLAFHAHINVEYCGWSMLIKYLFKYISKGPDRILGKIENSVEDASTSTSETHIQVDEIQNYVDGRFICPFEACWRILEYPIHRREPAVQILNVHLENMQRVNFRERDRLDVIVNLPDRKKTTLTEWYVYNNEHTDGRHLTYLDFPSEFVWYSDSKSWHRRVVRTRKSLGRLTYVHPSSGDLFYFRMLLSHQKGCKSPIEVRTVNGQVLPTYRAACEALGLLGDDREWDIALEESGISASSAQLRTLFAQILVYCHVSDPPKLWRKHWEAMKDDIPAKISDATGIVSYHVNTSELQDHILYELETILNGFGKSGKEFGLPSPSERLLKDLKETSHPLWRRRKKLQTRQHSCKDCPLGNVYLCTVIGEQGKTFLWKTIISSLRSQGKIVLAVASSGIASLLLPAGRTAHSRFKLPLELTDESVCHAKKHSQLGNLLVETNLIIWDEAPMNDKRCFEALDRTLRDLMNASDTLFGGKTVVLGGDFRQTLPVKKGAAKQELIHASIADSYLWLHFKICILKQNMRLLRSAISDDERERYKVFAEWLLDVGNGEVGEADKDNNEDTFWITVPQQYCINPSQQALSELINFIYDEATLKTPNASSFQEKKNSCVPKNEHCRTLSTPFIPMSVTAIASLKVGQEDCIIEAKVYRKWISKSVPDMKEQAFCCILIDRENTAVQANMDLKNLNQFDQTLKLKTVYRISNFICENTKPYQQTLGNKISLKFGKITSFQVLPGKESEFPEHHFELISYNQLSSRVPYQDKQDSKMIYPILTDYLGRVRSISDITPFQDASGRQKYRRKVDIESLDGNVVEFTMWDDLATQFNKEEIEKLPPPIIIVVSSCRVTKYRDVQLSATPATYYYINPKNQEAENAYKMFEDKYSLNPPLQVTNYRYDDPEQEKTRNRQTLYALLQQNSITFKGVRFTCEAMITSLNNKRSWSYASCSQCSKASTKRNGVNTCEDHGEQEPPTYRYNFKVTVADGTATAEFTFFTAAGQKITGHPCSYLKQKYEPTDTSQLPVEMVNTIGEKHIFQIEFDPSTQKGAGRFIVNDILDINPPIEKRNTGTF
ncbi:DNA helicase [Tanacetum coccineum]